MKFSMDFSLIIAVLVLVQLFLLNIKVEESDKSKKNMETELEEDMAFLEDEENDYLVVHRSNGEEKKYSKKNVA